jgi:hypothetical protein
MHKPRVPHWQTVKRILRYLKNTILYGLLIISQTNHSHHGYNDVDWVGDIDDHHSIDAYCVFHGKNSIS